MKYSSRGKNRSRIAFSAVTSLPSATSAGLTHHHYRGTHLPPTDRLQSCRMRDRRLTVLLAWATPLIACLRLASSAAGAYVPGEVLVGHDETTSHVPVPPGSSMAATVARLRAQPGVSWAVPD